MMSTSYRSSYMVKRCVVVFALLALTLGANILFFPATTHASGTSFYVDCSASSNGNGTQAAPWNTLSSVNSTTFLAGDHILFKRGTGSACHGTLHPLGSGASGSPIVIDTYSSGSLPIIAGDGASDAVSFFNQQYWEIRNLEITNDSTTVANRRGVHVVAQDFGTANYYRLTNLSIHNVKGDDAKDLGGSAGIQFEVYGTTTQTKFNDVVIEGNTIQTVDRSGINSSSSWYGDRPTSGASAWATGWTNYIIRHNSLSDIGGDGIVAQHTNGALVEYNVLNGSSKRSPGCNVGIWAFDANNSTFQYNEVSNVAPGCDSTGYDVDFNQDNTLFQYNYSHNNAGGFILDCRFCGGPFATNSTVRYNISVNDGSGHDYTGENYYNNTVYRDAGTSATFTTISGLNNIFYEGKGSTDTVNCTGTCDYNLVYHIATSGNAHGITANPLFVNPGAASSGLNTLDGLKLLSGSPALGAGTLISNNGGKDFFGNSVSNTASPTIGAYEGNTSGSSNLIQNAGLETGTLNPWAAWIDATVVSTNAHTGSYALRVGSGPASAEQVINGLNPNTTYTLTGWGKVANAGEGVYIGVKDFGGTETSTGLTSTSYTRTGVTFTTGSSSSSARIYFYKDSGSGYAYGDDFSLVPGTSPNLVQNAGLETGTLNPWAAWIDATVVNTNAHTGSYALRVGSGPASAEQVINGLNPNTTYTLTGWGKVANAGEGVYIGVKDFGGIETSAPLTSTSYTQASITFTTGSSSSSARIYFYKDSGSGYAYGDDFFLIAS